MLRSLLAVLAGYAAMAVFVTGAGLALVLAVPEAFHQEEARVDQPWMTVLVGAGLVAAVLGGYVTAWIARRAELAHALALGAVVLALWFVDAALTPLSVPTWYQVGILLCGVFGVLVGGGLRFAVARRGGGETHD